MSFPAIFFLEVLSLKVAVEVLSTTVLAAFMALFFGSGSFVSFTNFPLKRTSGIKPLFFSAVFFFFFAFKGGGNALGERGGLDFPRLLLFFIVLD